jgi:hypothetical protein
MAGDDDAILSEFQAARMQNYMTKYIADGWTPEFHLYDKVITANHGAIFYDACLDKMLL